MDEVSLTAAEADLANAIRAVDAQLDELTERERRVLGFGMRAGGAGGWFAHRAEDELDGRRAALQQRRAELAAQLRRQVEGADSGGVGGPRSSAAPRTSAPSWAYFAPVWLSS